MVVGIRAVGPSFGLAAMVVASLAGRPAALAAQQSVTVSGVFHTVWVDPRNAPASDPLYFVSGGHGVVRLDIDAAALARAGGRQALERRRLTVSGVLDAPVPPAPGQAAVVGPPAVLRVTSIHPENALVAAAPQAGSLAYATILCRFPDVGALPGAQSRYQAITGTSSPGLDHYWREVSENVIDLAGSFVTDWYTLPQPYSFYVTGTTVNLAALAEDCSGAADADIDFSAVDGINMQFNGGFQSSWGGGWWFTRDGLTRVMPTTWLADWAGQSVYAHEVGHSLGLPHSSGQYGQVYDSPWDVMSSAYVRFVGGTHDWIGQQTITYHKGLLGWIGDRSLTVETNAVEATLGRSAQPAAGTLLEVRVPVAGTSQFYTVEARKRTGYDTGLPREGVVIHLVNPALPEPAHVQDGDANGTTNDEGSAWLPGETFWDPSNRVAVRVESGTATGWTIRARRNAGVVSATVVGPGAVTADPGGIACPGDCSEPYGGGESVTLSAEPNDGAVFTGWSGACSGTGDCVLAASENVSVTATFVAPVAVTVTVEGLGTVTSTPAGILCPDDCTESVPTGTSIELTAVPADGVVFGGWGGACTGTAECVLEPTDDIEVTATFSSPLAITSASARPGAIMGAAYTDQLEADGGDGVHAWSLAAGSLPEGVSLSATGAINGTPGEAGAFTFTARTASDGLEATKEFTLLVVSPTLAVTAVVDALIAEQPALGADERRYLDLQGNRNGRVDAGDVRAWLQRQGVVTVTERKEQ
jgi:M6 family metalloprotease-like protein